MIKGVSSKERESTPSGSDHQKTQYDGRGGTGHVGYSSDTGYSSGTDATSVNLNLQQSAAMSGARRISDTTSTSTSRSDNDDEARNNAWNIQRLRELEHSKNWQESWNPRMSMSLTSTKGLLNAPGDNNCFLNSAVQVLWHLDVFRRSFRLLSGHRCLGSNSCIFCALKVIFTQFQYSDQSALPPDSLRTALAKTFAEQQRFQLGLMDDAAECFENILTQIHFHIANGEPDDMCKAKHCISHQTFAMTVVEQIVCQCQATSEPHPFNQMVYYVSTSALVNQVKSHAYNGPLKFGHLLQQASTHGDYRNCPSNCGRKVQLRRTLMNSPQVVSVGLVWDSDNPSPEHIHDVVRSVGTTLSMTELFHSVVEPRCRQSEAFQLVGIVCYYGKHYSTFFFHTNMKTWVSFDDANIREMGSQWSTVVDKCCRGHYQPLLLLYARANPELISTATAPEKTVIVKESRFLNNNDDPSKFGFSSGGIYHCRQRSCDSLSGTIGGQCSESSLLDFEDIAPTPALTKGRRSMTPDPDFSLSESKSHEVRRRSVTPGPDMERRAGSHSDGATELLKPVTKHSRQPSYLTALNALDGTDGGERSHNKLTNGSSQQSHQVHRPNAVHAKPVSGSNIGAYSVRYAQQGQSNGVDLLGSLPQPTQQPPHQYQYNQQQQQQQLQQQQQQPYHLQHHQQQQQHPQHYHQQPNSRQQYGQTSTSQQSVHTSVPSQQYTSRSHTPYHPQGSASSHYTSAPGVSVQQPIVSVARSTTTYQVTNSHRGSAPHYSSAPYAGHNGANGSHLSAFHPNHTHTQNNVAPTPGPAPSHHVSSSGRHHDIPSSQAPIQSAPNTPVIRRTQSAETGVTMSNRQPPPISRSRPSSARPYDYGNSRPTVDPQTGAVVMPNRHVNKSNEEQHWGHNGEDLLIGDFTTPDSCQPGIKPRSSGSQADPDGRRDGTNGDQDDYDDYISPKTVQNVLNIQKSRHSGMAPGVAGGDTVGGIKTAPIHSTGATSVELAEQRKQKQAWLHNEALMRGLKVDIPTSGDNVSLPGSHKDSGYRSGGSSTNSDRHSASSTHDSPTPDNFPRAFHGLHRPLSHTQGSSGSHSSTESLSSTQSGQTVKTIQGNRLSLIPETAAGSGHQSQDIRASSSQGGLDMESLRISDRQQHYVNTGAGNFQPMDPDCERLFLQADGLMESSKRQEEMSDVHSALAYCSQAVQILQQALTLCGNSQGDTAVRLRVKHNACLLRSRHLHKHLTDQQQQQKQQQQQRQANPGAPPTYSRESSVGSASSKGSDDRMSSSSSEAHMGQTRAANMQHPPRNHVSDQINPSRPGNQQQQTQSQLVTKHLAVTGMAQSRPVTPGITMGLCDNVSRSSEITSSQRGPQPPSQTNPSRSRNNSVSDELERNIHVDPNDTRNAELYGTLPKRKGKAGCKSPVTALSETPGGPSGGSAQVYQSYLQRQHSASTTMDPPQAHNTTNTQHHDNGQKSFQATNAIHKRQLSKDEVRDMLIKDFVHKSAPKPAAENVAAPVPHPSKPAPPVLRRRNSYDPLESHTSSSGAHPAHYNAPSGFAEWERPKQPEDSTPKVPLHELPLKTRRQLPQAPSHPPQTAAPHQTKTEESHYDYLPGRNKAQARLFEPGVIVPKSNGAVSKQQQPVSSSHHTERENFPVHVPANPTNPAPGQFSHQPEQHSPNVASCQNVKPSMVKNLEKTHQSGAYVKAYEIQRPGEQGKPAVAETIPIKVKPEIPPKAKSSSKSSSSPGKPAKPSKPAKPVVPKRINSQLSTFKGDSENSGQIQARPQGAINLSEQSSSQSGFYSVQDGQMSDFDLPPPPDDLLYPAPPSPDPGNHACQCTCGASNQASDVSQNHCDRGVTPVTAPVAPNVNSQSSSCGGDVPDGRVSVALKKVPRPPRVPTKPQKKKSVSFSDNVALIATPEDVSQEIDYVAYVMQLGRRRPDQPSTDDNDDDTDDNTVDSMDGDAMLADGDETATGGATSTVLCTLCRKKQIAPTEIYCQGCCFYMSRFQPADEQEADV